MDYGMDPKVGGMLGQMMAQPMNRNMQAGNPALQMQPQGPSNIGQSGQMGLAGSMQSPDGSFNTFPLQMLLEKMNSQNKLKKLKEKETQQMLKMLTPRGGAASAGGMP